MIRHSRLFSALRQMTVLAFITSGIHVIARRTHQPGCNVWLSVSSISPEGHVSLGPVPPPPNTVISQFCFQKVGQVCSEKSRIILAFKATVPKLFFLTATLKQQWGMNCYSRLITGGRARNPKPTWLGDLRTMRNTFKSIEKSI